MGPLLRHRLSCFLTLEQLRSVPSRGTVPIGLQTWLGLGGPDGCSSLLTTPCVCVCVCVCLFVCLFDRVSRSRWSSHDAHVSWENIVGVCAPDGERCQTLVLGRQNCSPPRNLPGLASRPWGNRSFAVGLARPYAYALLSSASSGGPVGGRMLLPPLPCLRPAGYWTLRPICPPCHVCGWRGTGRSVPSAPPLAMSTAGGVRNVQSHLPPGLSGFGVLRDVHSRHQPMGRLGTGR